MDVSENGGRAILEIPVIRPIVDSGLYWVPLSMETTKCHHHTVQPIPAGRRPSQSFARGGTPSFVTLGGQVFPLGLGLTCSLVGFYLALRTRLGNCRLGVPLSGLEGSNASCRHTP